jgi:hypothetical protein
MQPLLGLPGDGDHVGGLALLTALERLASGGQPAGEIGTLARCRVVLFQRPLSRTRRDRFRSPGSPAAIP